jgi:hypothetical protein
VRVELSQDRVDVGDDETSGSATPVQVSPNCRPATILYQPHSAG